MLFILSTGTWLVSVMLVTESVVVVVFVVLSVVLVESAWLLQAANNAAMAITANNFFIRDVFDFC